MLSDPQAQLVQLLGHTRPAVAAQAQPMLFADMGQDHHIAPLTDGRGACAATRATRDPLRPSCDRDGGEKGCHDSRQ